jgi:hypothetical protein
MSRRDIDADPQPVPTGRVGRVSMRAGATLSPRGCAVCGNPQTDLYFPLITRGRRDHVPLRRLCAGCSRDMDRDLLRSIEAGRR